MIVQLDEKPFVANHFLPPRRTIHFHQLIENLA